MSVGKSQPG